MLSASAILMALSSAASAQEVVMRRPIPMSMTVDGGASWKTTPWIIFDASNAPVSPKDACGDYVERRTVYCGKADGAKVEELYCRGQEKPIVERPARHDEGCTYAWSTSEWRDPGASCSLKEPQSRDVRCLRDADRAVMDDRFCSGAKPDADRTVEDFATCTYTWKAGGFVDPGPSCTNAEKQDQTVWCERDLDRTVAASESLCDPSKRPASSQSVRDISACSYSWKTGPFVDPGASCTRAETQTRDVTCRRSLNDELADDAACRASDKPTTTQTVEDYATCSFKAVEPGAWTPSSTCSATATKTRTYKCQRSNDGGEIVDAALCGKAGVSLTETVPEANYSSCSYSWSYGAWNDPGASCTGAEPQTRVAWCKRDLDDQKVDDALCNAAARELLTRTVADYSACQPYWYSASGWSDWSSYCSANATRTREIGCFRNETACTPSTPNLWSDQGGGNCAVRLSNAECQAWPTATRAGFSPASGSESAALYSSCTNSWRQSGFADPGASCGNETWTQTVSCKRDLDNAPMPDASCNAATRPSTTDVRYDVSGCGYTAVNPGAWTPSSTCSATATKTRTYQCRRGDGQIVAGTECTSRGVSLTETVPEANYSTCSNSWRQSGFVDPGASCGNETWTQTVSCKRDLDNAPMPDASCNAGTRPPTTDVRYDVSACGYTAVNWTAWSWNNTCSATATRTQTAQCRRGDGQIVADVECTSRGVSLSSSVTEANYSGCTYTPGASQSACTGGQATQTNSCRRNQTGEMVSTSFCGTPATQSVSCTSYRWVTGGFGGFGACQAPGVQYQYRDVYCEANNGGNLSRVDGSLCQNAGLGGAPTTVNSQGCQYYSYRWVEGGFGDWNTHCGSATRSQAVWCYRNPDNVMMDPNQDQCYASAGAKPAWQQSAYVIDGCGYNPTYGGYGACQPEGRRYADMTACTRTDGQGVSTAECTSRGSAARISEACSYTSTRHELRDYDGWAKNNMKMCSRIRMQAWFCNGYSNCTVGPIKYNVNSLAVCNVEADVTSGPYDGTSYGVISYDIPELMGQ